MAEKKEELTKPWYLSKLVWFNVVYTLAEFILVWIDYLPDRYIPYAMALQGMISVILRIWFTDTKLTAK